MVYRPHWFPDTRYFTVIAQKSGNREALSSVLLRLHTVTNGAALTAADYFILHANLGTSEDRTGMSKIGRYGTVPVEVM